MRNQESTNVSATAATKQEKETQSENWALVQRSLYVPYWLWEASKSFPEGRQKAIINYLVDRVTHQADELMSLEIKLKESKEIEQQEIDRQQILKIRIEEIRQSKIKEDESKLKSEQNALEAINACTLLLRTLGSGMFQSHFSKLQSLTGIPANQIKEFLESKNWRASDEEISKFFLK